MHYVAGRMKTPLQGLKRGGCLKLTSIQACLTSPLPALRFRASGTVCKYVLLPSDREVKPQTAFRMQLHLMPEM